MSDEQHAETEAAEESGPTNLEQFQQITDEQVAAALDGATRSSADRQAAAEAREVEAPAETGPKVDVAQVWATRIDEDVDLVGREEELALAASAYLAPELAAVRTEQDAVDVLEQAKAHLELADQQAAVGDVVTQQALSDFEETLLSSDDDLEVVRALDELIERVPPDDPRLLEALSLAEALSPGGVIAFRGMLQSAQVAELAEAQQAEAEAIAEHAAEVTEAVEAELAEHEKTLVDPRVRQIAAALFEGAEVAADPQEARAQVRMAIHGADQIDAADRTNSFLQAFDQRALGAIPSDSAREEALAAAGESWATPQISEQPSRQERVNAFLDAFDQRTGRRDDR